eukprot:GHVT01033135.1.p1 GENE.GHVT01033135.1~~GHVT01033135.1.p1  ORF type:complete len:364 (+),score=30.13 GHVT01033135.1:1175-2266(+)
MVDEGYFAPSYVHVFYRNLEILVLFCISYYLLSIGRHWSSMLLGGLAGGRAGWVQHEGGHRSLTGSIAIDGLIQKFWMAFGLITHSGKWNSMHNRHHASPQKESFDPDVDTLPLIATYRDILTRGARRALALDHFRWWLKYQHISFLLVSSAFNVFFWHLYLHPREYVFRKFDPLTLLLVAGRYAVHFCIALPAFGIGGAFITLAGTMFFTGIYLFGTFALSHTFLPTVKAEDEMDWVDNQVTYSANMTPCFTVNWWMGYLNFQVEHHLFPQMPQYHQPKIAGRVRDFCEENGLSYNLFGFFEGMFYVLRNLRRIACEVDDIYYQTEKEKQKGTAIETSPNDAKHNEKTTKSVRHKDSPIKVD